MNNKNYQIESRMTDPEFFKVIAFMEAKIPVEKVFSRMSAIKANPYGSDIKKFIDEFNTIYGKDPHVELGLYEDYDPENYYYSSRISFKLNQIGFKSGTTYAHPKTNTYALCPFCELKPQNPGNKHKEHLVEISDGKDGKIKRTIDSNIQGFYDTGQSGLSHHMANCHGVLKKSLMPQPFVGFSKSLSKDKDTYLPSIICPHQHWNKEGQLVGCNSIFPYRVKKNAADNEHPFKTYFRHFHQHHVSEPKTEAEKEAAAAKLAANPKEHKHIQTADNLFLPFFDLANSETINYQHKNTKDLYWNQTLKTADDDIAKRINRFCVQGKEKYYRPSKKDDPAITHVSIPRPRNLSASSPSGTSSDGSRSSSKKTSTVPSSNEPTPDAKEQNNTTHNQTAQRHNSSASKNSSGGRVTKPTHNKHEQTSVQKNMLQNIPAQATDNTGPNPQNNITMVPQGTMDPRSLHNNFTYDQGTYQPPQIIPDPTPNQHQNQEVSVFSDIRGVNEVNEVFGFNQTLEDLPQQEECEWDFQKSTFVSNREINGTGDSRGDIAADNGVNTTAGSSSNMMTDGGNNTESVNADEFFDSNIGSGEVNEVGEVNNDVNANVVNDNEVNAWSDANNDVGNYGAYIENNWSQTADEYDQVRGFMLLDHIGFTGG